MSTIKNTAGDFIVISSAGVVTVIPGPGKVAQIYLSSKIIANASISVQPSSSPVGLGAVGSNPILCEGALVSMANSNSAAELGSFTLSAYNEGVLVPIWYFKGYIAKEDTLDIHFSSNFQVSGTPSIDQPFSLSYSTSSSVTLTVSFLVRQ